MPKSSNTKHRLETRIGVDTPGVSLITMDANDRRQVAAAAALHAMLLPESFVSHLGDYFMRSFYYPRLGGSGLIRCVFAVHDGQYVGLIVFTDRPDDFMQVGLRRHLPSLAWATGWAILRRPSRLSVVWKVSSDKQGRQERNSDGAVGEILTVGVVRAYRGRKFGDPQRTVASQLLHHTIDSARGWNLTQINVVTKRDNERSIALYESHGFNIQDPDYPEESCLLSMDLQQTP